MKHKDLIGTQRHVMCGGQIKQASEQDAKAGIIEAIVSVFDTITTYGDRMRPGCFTESLAKRTPAGVWCHGWDQPVAKTLEIRELMPGDALLPDDLKLKGGLYVKAQFNLDTQRGREAYSDIAFGIVTEFSIGFRIKSGGWAVVDDVDVYDVTRCDLYEWSPVIAGANESRLLTASDDPEGMTLTEHFEVVIAAASRLGVRVAQCVKERQAGGKNVRGERAAQLRDLQTKLDTLVTLIEDYAPGTDDEEDTPGSPVELDDSETVEPSVLDELAKIAESIED